MVRTELEDAIHQLSSLLYEDESAEEKYQQYIELKPFRQGDLHYFCCDTSKAHGDFAWESTVLPQEGISELVDWIYSNKELFTKEAKEG